MYDDEKENEIAVCPVCPHHCRLPEGKVGRCRARGCRDGRVVPLNYGKVTSIALDPIEKKPLSFFFPGSKILSVGSYDIPEVYTVTPEEILSIALDEIPSGNIGVAYTYNEALVGYEFVRDTAMLVHEHDMKNVLVTNGTCKLPVLEEILPYIDAMNIDLKGFRQEIYEKLGGDLETVKTFIKRSAEDSHVEITSLIVPGLNDSPEDMEDEAKWIASIDPAIPLHITRYFPRYRYNEAATEITLMRELKLIAERHLKRVLLGNV